MKNRLQEIAKRFPAKNRAKDWWARCRRICDAMGDSGMRQNMAAKKVYLSDSALRHNLLQMEKQGLRPRDFHWLAKRLGYVKRADAGGKGNVMHEEKCPNCGARSYRWLYTDGISALPDSVVGCDLCLTMDESESLIPCDPWEIEWGWTEP